MECYLRANDVRPAGWDPEKDPGARHVRSTETRSTTASRPCLWSLFEGPCSRSLFEERRFRAKEVPRPPFAQAKNGSLPLWTHAMIGVYDSGFGGLTILRHVRLKLPERSTCYLGDSGRAPYGGRDVHTILDFAEQAVERLFDEGCQLVIVACHTVSCVGLRHLQQRYCAQGSGRRILGVAIPGAEIATSVSRGRIGLLATEATVASKTYDVEVAKLGDHTVVSRAAPVLPPIVEEGWEDSPVARAALRAYIADMPDIDTLLLGCTHFPLLHAALHDVVPPDIHVIDPGPFVAERLGDWLRRHPSFDSLDPTPVHRLLCTGDPTRFALHGARFLGMSLPAIEPIGVVDGRLEARDPRRRPVGQVVRPH